VSPLYFVVPALSFIIGLAVYFVRTQADLSASEKVEKISAELIAKIDKLRDDIAELTTLCRLAEERHGNIVQRVDRLEQDWRSARVERPGSARPDMIAA
jgi:hypothetical protein